MAARVALTISRTIRRLFVAVALAAAVSGCATTGGGSPQDPLQPLNRAVFGFNETFDKVLLKPVAEGYRAAVPGVVRTGVTNFFSNLGDVWIGVNDVLQGKPVAALHDAMRVVINTIFGVGGLVDVAYDAGFYKQNEDFGQTLGRWGVGSGPYLVLPFLGPSTVRDALAYFGADSAADPVWNANNVPTRDTLYALRAVNDRANALGAIRVMEGAALDKYRFIRDSYLQRRRSLIYDGNPPPEGDAASAAAKGADARVRAQREVVRAEQTARVAAAAFPKRSESSGSRASRRSPAGSW